MRSPQDPPYIDLLELHEGIARKAGSCASCADFVRESGHTYDLDFLVASEGDSLWAIQGIVHSVDGVKPPYHLETPPAASHGLICRDCGTLTQGQ